MLGGGIAIFGGRVPGLHKSPTHPASSVKCLSQVPTTKSHGFWFPQVEAFEQDISQDLGPLQFVKLRKHHSLVDDAWFCDRITVQGPGAFREATFPCYRWVQGEGVLTLPEGTGEGLPQGSGSRAHGVLRKKQGEHYT